MNNLELHVTLWPSFDHFDGTVKDSRVDGMRLNGPITFPLQRIIDDFKRIPPGYSDKLHFDIKARQLRVIRAFPYKDHLELKVSHKIDVPTLPATVLFKDGTDYANLVDVKDNMLIFNGGPKMQVLPCEPVYLRPPNFTIKDKIISPYEIERIKIAKANGIDNFMLSYVESPDDIAELRDYVGKDAHITAKIESRKGLIYVANEFVKKDNLSLMLARGDLYVEVNMPHEIINATRMVIEKDPEAMVGSRILHSLRTYSNPECSDFSELAWLSDLGYKKYLLCDELCLKPELLSKSINIFNAFRTTSRASYDKRLSSSNEKQTWYKGLIKGIGLTR
jgi:hypothetical protein